MTKNTDGKNPVLTIWAHIHTFDSFSLLSKIYKFIIVSAFPYCRKNKINYGYLCFCLTSKLTMLQFHTV